MSNQDHQDLDCIETNVKLAHLQAYPVMSPRWSASELQLRLASRSCPGEHMKHSGKSRLYPLYDQSMNLHLLSLGLIRGVIRQ